jgi:hypothetical protein
VAAILAAALLPGVLRLSTDNSPRVFFVEGSPGVAAYEELQRLFGGDKIVRIAVEGPDLWTAEGLAVLRRLEQEAARVPGVASVSGLYGHARGGGRREWPPADPQAFRRRVVNDPLSRNLGWVGAGGEVATVLLDLSVADNREKGRVLAELEATAAAVAATDDSGLRLTLAGSPVLDRALDRSTREIERRYFPLLVGLAVVLLAITFRRPAAVVMPLVFVAAAEGVTLGALGWAGVELNLVLAILPPLLFVISLATAVHLLVAFRNCRSGGVGPSEAVVQTYADKGWAVLWTGVSTLVGFASLSTSKVGPVHTLGLWAGFGIAAMTLLAFGLYPALLPAAAGPRGAGGRPIERFFQRHGRRWAEGAARRRGGVLAVAGLTAAVALAGLPRLTLETNALHYLGPEHPVRSAIEDLQQHGIGTFSLELMLQLPPEEAEAATFADLAAFGRLAHLAEKLRREPLVLGVVGPGDLLDDAVRQAPGGAFFGAATARRVAFDRLLEELERAAPEPAGQAPPAAVLRRFLTPDGRAARLSLLVRAPGMEQMAPLRQRVETAAREAFPDALAETTGELPLVLETQRHLLRTLGVSLTLTLLVVTLIFRWLLPSTRLTLLAMLPNLWPVIGVLGLMGWLRVPLDVATVMVASVVLGLAVDDTIHTLGHFRELAPRLGRLEAVAGTLEQTAPSYVVTGLILGAGFGVCALSDFAPTARFGALSAAAIALAVVGDLFLLPALLGSTPVEVVERLGKNSQGA